MPPTDSTTSPGLQRLCRRAFAGDAGDHHAVVHFGCVKAKPRARGMVRPADRQHVVHDRLQEIGRHEHVQRDVLAILAGVLQLQRADADEVAFRADEPGAAPVGVRGRGEDRLVEEVLPVAGKLLARDDARGDRVGDAAAGGGDDAGAGKRGVGVAEGQGRDVDAAERLDQAEAGLLIESDDVAREGCGRRPA